MHAAGHVRHGPHARVVVVTDMRTTAPRRLLRLDGDAAAPRFTGLDARLRAELAEWLRTEAGALPPAVRADIAAAIHAPREATGDRL